VMLVDIVENAVETARPAIDGAGHLLTVSLPPEPVFIFGDLTRLAQVFSNLLSNSAKYTERCGQIWLTAKHHGPEVIVSVRDTGVGIPAAALPHIFDMFSQVDRSIERNTGGLGIGLALVKGLVEMHGGTITAQSEGPGHGSTFTVRLPALSPFAELVVDIPSDDDPLPLIGPGRRILVVDDNRDATHSMAIVLGLMGNVITTAHDGLEAIEAAERHRPEIILMDIGMPKLNGYDAVRRIRDQPWGRTMIIVALTGWGQEGDQNRSRAAGCDGHLVKPVEVADLAKLLAKLAAAKPLEATCKN